MKRDFNPVGVKLNIENPSIERDAFYRLCFITESDIAPRTLKVTRLQDLLESGYSRLDLVYNFCVGVFSQQGIDTVYIRAKRSSESYVEAYNSDDNSMYYFVVLQTKDLTEIEKFNNHLVSSDEMKLQFFSQNVGSKTLQSPKLVNYYQDYTRPEGGVSSDDRDFYLNSAYEGLVTQIKLSLPDYLLSGFGNIAIDYGIYKMTGKKQIWEIDKAERRIRYAPEVLQQGWVGSREESTVNGSDITVVAYMGSGGVSKKSTVLNPKVKVETLSRELLKGLGKEVLDYAIPLIDPEATDWVLDPENNTVKYKDPDAVPDDGSANSEYRYCFDNGTCYYTPDSACQALVAGSPPFQYHSYTTISPNTYMCRAGYGSPAPDDFMSINFQLNPDYVAGGSDDGSGAYSYEAYGTQHYYSSLSAACAGALSISNNAGQFIGAHISDTEKIRDTEYRCHYDGAGSGYFEVSYNPDYEAPPSVDKHLPIDTVAAQVIANAEAEHVESQEFLKSIPLFAYILTGSGTEAVNKSVLDIEPEATDWALDPENNSVKYTVSSGGSASQQYIISYQPTISDLSGQSYPTAQAAADAVCSLAGKNGFDYWYDGIPSASNNQSSLRCKGGAGGVVYYSSVLNPDYDPNAPTTEEKSIPIDTVAAKVIENAESGHTPSQEALRLSTVERADIGEYDEALEAASIEVETSWKYLPIYDVAVQVKRNSIAGHAESIEAVNNSLPFELPDNDTPWAYVPEETSVTGSTTSISAKRTLNNQKLKSSITVAASSDKIGDSLIEGGGSDALAYAVPQLIGEGVDWLIENNSVVWTEQGTGSGDGSVNPSIAVVWTSAVPDTDYVYSSADAAAAARCAYQKQTYVKVVVGSGSGGYGSATAHCLTAGGSPDVWSINSKPNPAYDPSYDPSKKSIPIETVAAKVIENAESGHAPSQEAVKATALEGFVAGEHDAALDAAAVIDN